ncbi:(S)-N-methylcoclaurine 3'-hydroxylase isozyme 1-like [Aristolochia californica]|uniref:(S)-N-methylcoclaurine 3'-hydroxylase isozyme 1-like n=1 Tax=Aristolochia californica TaxID=171875 RepID=UPI0035D96A4E
MGELNLESAALFLLLAVLLRFCYLALSKSQGALPPGPRPWPLVGNLLHLSRKGPHVDLAKLAHTYGPILSLRLGTELLVVASSPSMAAQVLKTHDRVLSARFVPHTFRVKDYLEYSLGWADSCDEIWKSFRTFCKTELFSSKTLGLQTSLREEKVSQLVLSALDREGKEVEIGELVFETALNVLSGSIFSRDIFTWAETDQVLGLKSLISRLMEMAVVPNLSDIYPLLGALDIQGLNREATKHYHRMNQIWETLIQEKKLEKSSSPKSDFLSILLDAGFSDLQLKAFFTDMFVAGTDTTTRTTEWTFSEIIRNPEVMARVRDELQRVVGERIKGENIVKERHLVHLRYLHACIKESLRLHPPVPLLVPRRALENCKVMNYVIPKGCRVMVNLWAIGRDPEIWKDPLKFMPERFLDSGLDFKGNDFEFTPFGAGRRICPGLPLASVLVTLNIASLIHSLDWSLPPGLTLEELDTAEKIGLTLAKEKPLVLVPRVA